MPKCVSTGFAKGRHPTPAGRLEGTLWPMSLHACDKRAHLGAGLCFAGSVGALVMVVPRPVLWMFSAASMARSVVLSLAPSDSACSL